MSTQSKLLLSGGVGLLAVILLAAVTFPLWRPLFVDDVVDEAFPAPEASLPESQAAAIPQDAEVAEPMEEEAPVPDAGADSAEQGMDDMAEAVMTASGQFIDIDSVHGGHGSATLYELPDGSRVLRFEDFEVTNGPDLHVVLSAHPDPRTPDEIGDYLDLGMLKGNVGSQNYDIPAEADLSQYQSVVIYCVPFEVVFSTASLSA